MPNFYNEIYFSLPFQTTILALDFPWFTRYKTGQRGCYTCGISSHKASAEFFAWPSSAFQQRLFLGEENDTGRREDIKGS